MSIGAIVSTHGPSSDRRPPEGAMQFEYQSGSFAILLDVRGR